MDAIKCGENLKKAREKKEISRQELANQLGLSDAASISNWERGKNAVPDKYHNQVAIILEIAESEFVSTIGYVYVFTFLDVKLEENNCYPCKIGRTENQSVESRIKWKVREWRQKHREYKILLCLPVPKDECKTWEDKIHNVLKSRDRWIVRVEAEGLDLKGREWFYTNPDEVKSIYEDLHRAGC